MRIVSLSSVLLLAVSVHAAVLEKRQSTSQLLAALNQISTTIPGVCSAVCEPFLADFRACPAPTAAGIATCACTTAFLTDVQTCTACYTTEGDATGAQLAAIINGACAQAGAAIPAAGATTSIAVAPVASTTSLAAANPVTPVNSAGLPSINPATVQLNTASPSGSITTAITTTVSGMAMPTVVTAVLSEGGYAPFPIQTKNANVFTGAASKDAIKRSLYGLSAAAVAAIVFA